MKNPALDAAEVVEVYRTFNRLHREALDPTTSKERYATVLDQMEAITTVARTHIGKFKPQPGR